MQKTGCKKKKIKIKEKFNRRDINVINKIKGRYSNNEMKRQLKLCEIQNETIQ